MSRQCGRRYRDVMGMRTALRNLQQLQIQMVTIHIFFRWRGSEDEVSRVKDRS